jgi:hypothetical protein
MLPTSHIIYGLVLSAFLFIFGIPISYVAIIFSASVLIDFDHYIFYVALKKDINPIKAVKWYFIEGKKYENNLKYQFAFLQIFHTVEFLLILAILSFFNKIVLLIFIGCVFHTCIDITYHIVTKKVYLK